MNSKTLRYKIGTTEIIALVVLVILSILIKKFVFIDVALESSTAEHLTHITLLSVFSALYGAVVGGVGGFVSTVCVYVIFGETVGYGNALAMAAFGFFAGRFASVYLIRDGLFAKKKLFVFAAMNSIACIVALVYVKPFLNYIIYDVDLMAAVREGIKETIIFSTAVNLILTVILYWVNRTIARKKT